MATVSRFRCPECDKVLKPTKPLPVGKRVTCPKCGTEFKVMPEADEVLPVEDVLPAEPPPKKARPAVAKKAAARKPEPKKEPPKKRVEGEEDAATYRFIDEIKPRNSDEDDEDEDDKPEINYAPDLSIKDLRGPAQEAVVGPSNKLMMMGLTGFIGWLGLLVVILIPVLFPLQHDDKDKDKGARAAAPAAGKKVEEKEASPFEVAGFDLAEMAALRWYIFILSLLPLFLGMGYSCLLTVGAVKMQNLESRAWGITASIMAMIPINIVGFMALTWLLMNIVLGILMDPPTLSFVIMCIVEIASGIGIGVWGLVTLMKPEVIAGYEYRPE